MASFDESSSHVNGRFLNEALGNRPATGVRPSMIIADRAFTQGPAFHLLAHHHIGKGRDGFCIAGLAVRGRIDSTKPDVDAVAPLAKDEFITIHD
jgi:hypothetical protein